MFFSPTAIRRYTPPTCTLKIVGKTSPLSRWSSQTLFKDVRFELDFDDPRQVAEDRVSIAGNREQLEGLCEVVETYVQDFLLHSSPSRLASLSSFLGSAIAVEPSPQATAALSPQEESGETPLKLLPPTPSLKPKGLLAHELYFGNLATPESGMSILLSTIQLFDLATALEEYSAEMAVLPATGNVPGRAPLPSWASAAAGVLLAVGVTATIMKLNQPSPTVVSTGDEELAANSPAIAPLPTPATALDSPVPSPTSPEAISTAKRLPPPPPVGSPGSAPAVPPAIAPESSPVVIRPQQQRTAPQAQQKRTLPSEPKVPVNRPPAPASAPRTAPAAPVETPALPDLPSLESSGDRAIASAPGNSRTSPSFETRERLESRGTVPQVTEVKNYFQQRWKPPESLSEPLEYDLLIDREGAIERLIPIGEAAGTYLDRTPMPLLGERFVSNVEGRGKPKIRLILNPNGTVETRLQSLD